MHTACPGSCFQSPTAPSIYCHGTSYPNPRILSGSAGLYPPMEGQPRGIVESHCPANRHDTLKDAVRKTWSRGGFTAFYQGLIPWAWLEACTKGAILVLTSTEIEHHAQTKFDASPTVCSVLGGIGGGFAQAYLTMGTTTCMKTVEVTRTKEVSKPGNKPSSPMKVFFEILREKGIRSITGWSSRIGISRFAKESIRGITGKLKEERSRFGEKILASTIGGALSCWNQPFEVLRVEMQFMKNDPTHPAHPTIVSTFAHIVKMEKEQFPIGAESAGILGIL
ncbi:uncharacterized protein ASPGLDRAFT_1504091 [Aspergillus glaucus CBS 516.65]|uniref:Uncharacterized protein n=1 Tax=Aspergillus glaucus CBS 516.65 TaxID=1160497 RepID=A0A1L9V7V2_ASPGL|nr:hypothetical protein ASPGLDRAFT_1504091 [Aspergillus glaucus CBS 516.65]OJJ79939.1 hypothetical protein ASPGLDRAFT_1504091 [Aspergillus glaucus CBS 516.65]